MDHNKVITIVISTIDIYVVFYFHYTYIQQYFKLCVVPSFGSVHCNVRIIALECGVWCGVVWCGEV